MNYKDDLEYNSIVSQILNDREFSKLINIKHHDNNRLRHSLRVSYCSYKLAKIMHLSYEEVARGGLLHDFYLERTVDYNKIKDKIKLYTMHSKEALEKSNQLFDLTPMEQDMIKAHMFPLNLNVPKYAESWIVNTVDTIVSTYEFGQKFKYQAVSFVNLYLLFFINHIK